MGFRFRILRIQNLESLRQAPEISTLKFVGAMAASPEVLIEEADREYRMPPLRLEAKSVLIKKSLLGQYSELRTQIIVHYRLVSKEDALSADW